MGKVNYSSAMASDLMGDDFNEDFDDGEGGKREGEEDVDFM